jgi:hypothetical protein
MARCWANICLSDDLSPPRSHDPIDLSDSPNDGTRRVGMTPGSEAQLGNDETDGIGKGGIAAEVMPIFQCCGSTWRRKTGTRFWSRVDFASATWVVPAERMKTGEAFSVPLSDRAVAVLAEARQRARKPPTADSFVFFGTIPKRPLSPMSLSMLLRRMEIAVTVHGFRTTWRTWASEVAHAEFEIAEAALSHRVGSAVSRAYNRTNLTERRRPLMQSWSDFVEGKTGANVVVLKGGPVRAPRRAARP